MTPEQIQEHITFYHSIFIDQAKSDPERARAFIQAVNFMTPEEILDSNELAFADPNDTYRHYVQAIHARYPEIQTREELIAVLDYEHWKQQQQNPTSSDHE